MNNLRIITTILLASIASTANCQQLLGQLSSSQDIMLLNEKLVPFDPSTQLPLFAFRNGLTIQSFEDQPWSAYTLQYENYDDWVKDNQILAGMLPNLGNDQQIVSPVQAIGNFGVARGFAADAWVERVKMSEDARTANGALSCDAAISSLNLAICGDSSSCQIEEKYREQCNQSNLSQDQFTLCLNAERNYIKACFGDVSPAWFDPNSLTTGGTDPDSGLLCNATFFEFGGDDWGNGEFAIATARHCLEDAGHHFDAMSLRWPRPSARFRLMEADRNLSPFEPTYDLAFLMGEGNGLPDASELPTQGWLGSSRPELYAETVFVAYNLLSYYRAEMVRKNNHGFESLSYFHPIDASPLCTVVSYDPSSGVIQHTCQSSSGSSGGALIQYVNGRMSLVGVHLGFNDTSGNTWNNATFGVGSDFPQ